jgi:pyruvate, water dikinase
MRCETTGGRQAPHGRKNYTDGMLKAARISAARLRPGFWSTRRRPELRATARLPARLFARKSHVLFFPGPPGLHKLKRRLLNLRGGTENIWEEAVGRSNVSGSGSISDNSQTSPYVVWLSDARRAEHSRVGGKCAGLAALLAAGAPVPPGFAIATCAFARMLEIDGLQDEIYQRLESCDHDDIASQARISQEIRKAIMARPLPGAIEDAIRSAYHELSKHTDADIPVAVRSSGTGEDMPEASFAGQGDTYLWVVGEGNVLDRVKSCWSSLFNARAMAYRAKHGLNHLSSSMAVAVQQMVNARASGVAMTIDPTNGDRSKIVIESGWGLGELIVSGEVTPDHFVIDKIMLEPVKTTIGSKAEELVVDQFSQKTRRQPVELDRQQQPSVTDAQLKVIATFAKNMERHFGCPQDIEWAIDGHRGEDHGVVLLQCRPETVWSRRPTGSSAKEYPVGIEGVLDTLMKPIGARKQ